MNFLGLDFWASYIPQMGKVIDVQPAGHADTEHPVELQCCESPFFSHF